MPLMLCFVFQGNGNILAVATQELNFCSLTRPNKSIRPFFNYLHCHSSRRLHHIGEEKWQEQIICRTYNVDKIRQPSSPMTSKPIFQVQKFLRHVIIALLVTRKLKKLFLWGLRGTVKISFCELGVWDNWACLFAREVLRYARWWCFSLEAERLWRKVGLRKNSSSWGICIDRRVGSYVVGLYQDILFLFLCELTNWTLPNTCKTRVVNPPAITTKLRLT